MRFFYGRSISKNSFLSHLIVKCSKCCMKSIHFVLRNTSIDVICYHARLRNFHVTGNILFCFEKSFPFAHSLSLLSVTRSLGCNLVIQLAIPINFIPNNYSPRCHHTAYSLNISGQRTEIRRASRSDKNKTANSQRPHDGAK